MKFTLPTLRLSGTGLAAGAAAGVASVLLSMLTLQRPPLTLVLGFVSPLPVMIAALAFGPWAGVLAVAVGAIFVAVFDMKLGHLVVAASPSGMSALADSLVFLVGLGIPSWFLTFLARLPAPQPRAGAAPPRMRPDELRLSRVAVAATFFAIAAVATLFAVQIIAHGSLSTLEAALVTNYEAILKAAAEKGQSALSTDDLHRTAVWFSALVPWLMASFAVVFYLVNMWLAARIARTSGVFGTDWPDIPRNLRLPRLAALLLAVSLGLSFTTGPVALASHVVSAALVAAFSLQGLAVVHALTRGRTWRMPALVFVYGLVPLVFWALLGLFDAAFSFRDRQAPIIKNQPERKSPWK